MNILIKVSVDKKDAEIISTVKTMKNITLTIRRLIMFPHKVTPPKRGMIVKLAYNRAELIKRLSIDSQCIARMEYPWLPVTLLSLARA